MTGRIVSIRAGKVEQRDSPQGMWVSAIAKLPVAGPVAFGPEGVQTDAQADRVHHGGIDKAVLAYCAEHYDDWRRELRPDFPSGSLGENLEVSGSSEADVCIGDRFRAGNVLFELSQPRQPCWKPATLHGFSDLTTQMAKTSRTGWYLRVLEPGSIEAPCELELIDRPHPDWTVLRCNRLIYEKAEPHSARAALAALPQLSAAWRQMLSR